MKLLATIAFVAITGAMALPGAANGQEFYHRPRVVVNAYRCAPNAYRPAYVAPVYRERAYSNYAPARPYVGERAWDRREGDRDRGRWVRR
jgi:hypothetical protein